MGNRKPGQARSPIVRAEQRSLVAKYYKLGWLQVYIAKELGISQQQVSYDLQVIQKRWLESGLMDINEAKARELGRLDRLEVEGWTAWFKSQEAKETFSHGETPMGPTLSYKAEGQVGNPAFLAQIQECIKKRCDILGLIPKSGDEAGKGDESPEAQYQRFLGYVGEWLREREGAIDDLGGILKGNRPAWEQLVLAYRDEDTASRSA